MSFKNILCISAICVLIAGCSSTPSSSGRSESDNSNNVAKSRDTGNVENTVSGDTVVCKMRRPTGSRIPERQCMTADAWNRAVDEAKALKGEIN